jgi:hypothetical protein
MSTINTEKQGNVITLSGDMTNDYDQMKRECAGRYESMFGDTQGAITKLKASGCSAMTHEQVMKLYKHGTYAEYYKYGNIWCYFCVDPKNYKNYMFSPMEGENRDNQYSRLRNGVLNFSLDGFEVYVVECG